MFGMTRSFGSSGSPGSSDPVFSAGAFASFAASASGSRHDRGRRARGLILAGGLLIATASGHAHADQPAPAASVAPEDDFADDIQGNVPGASAIEGRLMAPCCWTQTIDIHDSEIALSMRHEIRRRLRNGESADAIQASFVERYGPKIMAVQPTSQLKNVFIGLAVAMGGAGVAAALMLGRWRKRTATADGPETKRSLVRDKWDERLDAELRELERD